MSVYTVVGMLLGIVAVWLFSAWRKKSHALKVMTEDRDSFIRLAAAADMAFRTAQGEVQALRSELRRYQDAELERACRANYIGHPRVGWYRDDELGCKKVGVTFMVSPIEERLICRSHAVLAAFVQDKLLLPLAAEVARLWLQNLREEKS